MWVTLLSNRLFHRGGFFLHECVPQTSACRLSVVHRLFKVGMSRSLHEWSFSSSDSAQWPHVEKYSGPGVSLSEPLRKEPIWNVNSHPQIYFSDEFRLLDHGVF